MAIPLFGADPTLPDPKLTPGVVATTNLDIIIHTKWGKDVRHVTEKMKHDVFSAYGIPWQRHKEFEVDHLISRELGGADDVKNLWPEPWVGTWNAHVKDRLENKMHKLVCTGQITLKQAQDEIKTDWIVAFKKYIAATP